MSRVGCLDRRLVKSLGAGRCTQDELATARRHLFECARCRAAVVAAASGLRGPGETVVMMRRASAKLPTGVKVAAVAVSLAVAGGAWKYGVAPRPTAPPVAREVDARAPLEPSAPALDDPPPLPETASAASTQQVAQALPLELPEAPESAPATPTVAVVPSSPAERPRARRRGNVVPARPRRAQAPQRAQRDADEGIVSEALADDEGGADEAVADDEVDFGIDEPAPRVGRHSIRTTLD